MVKSSWFIEMFIIVIGGICITYVLITQILEWMHHMEVIETRWPKAYKVLMNPAARILLLFVAIGLFAEVVREHRQEVIPNPGAAIGGAIANGTCNGANSGNGSKVEVNCAGKDTAEKPSK